MTEKRRFQRRWITASKTGYWRTLRREGVEEGREEGIRCTVEILQETGWTSQFVIDKIAEKYALSRTEAEKKTQRYWK